MTSRTILLFLLSATLGPLAHAQTSSIHEPVRYIGGVSIDPNSHEAGLRPAIGTHHYQILRANRSHPELAECSGWTYNHAPNLAYWNDTFYLQYLSNPIDEHVAPGQTLMSTSKDGTNWSKPEIVFPPYEAPAGVTLPEGTHGYMMHQRMGFYVAPDGRLLVLAFYGHAEDPFKTGGIGRVVREAYKDGSYGPIYFIRYESEAKWNESNTSFPFYTTSGDAGFVDACNALLADKLHTRQWYDEDNGIDGFHQPVGDDCEAFNWYNRKDGKIVGLWKWSNAALSDDGVTFSPPAKCPTFVMAGGKQWGQATDDGRYAIAYNPTRYNEHRYPLAAVTSDDGIFFDNMVGIQCEVPPQRYFGRWKDYGPCYTRGITPGEGNPPGNDMWLTYSMNKEDIWVSRVPVTVQYAVQGEVQDNFDALPLGNRIENWNIYSPQWAPISIARCDNGQFLQLTDRDPADYARAIRVFQEGTKVSIRFRAMARQYNVPLEIDVQDRYGNRPVRIKFGDDGALQYTHGHDQLGILPYAPGRWYQFELEIDATLCGSFTLKVDGKVVAENAPLAEAVQSVERISFRTGEFRNLPNRQTLNEKPRSPLAGADEPLEEAEFGVDDVVLAGK